MPPLEKLSRLVLVILLAFLPAALYAVIKLPVGSAGVHEWLPKGRPERQRYEEFLQQFGSDQVLIVSWDGANLEDPRVDQFVQLAQESVRQQSLISAAVSPKQVFESLEQSRLALSHQEASRRLEGVFIGKSGTVPIILAISDDGVRNHKRTIELVNSLGDRVQNLGKERLRLVGAVHESYAIDVAAEQNLSQLVLPSGILALAISWICLGSFRGVIVVMLLAGYGQLIAISVVYFGGYQFSAVLIVLPTLIFMLTLSGAIHLVNYLLEARRSNPSASGFQALIKGWWPCTLSSATTMLGMASLMTSDLAPVRQFGVLSAICLGIATVVLLLAFPAATELLFLGQRHRQASTTAQYDGFCSEVVPFPDAKGDYRDGQGGRMETTVNNLYQHAIENSDDSSLDDNSLSDNSLSDSSLEDRKLDDKKPGFLAIPQSLERRYLSWQQKRASAISIASLILLFVAMVGISKLDSSTKFVDMFPAKNKTHRDMIWYEEKIGPLATFEVLLKFDSQVEDNVLDQAKLVGQVSAALKQCEIVGACFSASTFLPKLNNEATGIRGASIRAAQKRSIEDHLDGFVNQGLVYQDATSRTWRISTRVSAVSEMGFERMIQIITERAKETVAQSTMKVEVEFTGLTKVMHETQQAILSDLGKSFLSAYLLITPAMMLVVRSFWGGLLIMLPNVLPIALAFGAMGWMGVSLDIAGILTASIALGIAVDDTLHFTCWYTSQLRDGRDRPESIRRAFHACASAMMHTTLISCCSMLPFLFAGFVPTHQFARLMVCILIAALAGDLILLPALLLSPAGKCIRLKTS